MFLTLAALPVKLCIILKYQMLHYLCPVLSYISVENINTVIKTWGLRCLLGSIFRISNKKKIVRYCVLTDNLDYIQQF